MLIVVGRFRTDVPLSALLWFRRRRRAARQANTVALSGYAYGRNVPIDIPALVGAYLSDRSDTARYASFDYCYNYLQDARDQDDFSRLAKGDGLILSCLNLGFYLASWGMMRGSSDLLQRSVRALVPVVDFIAAEQRDSWDIDVSNGDYSHRVLGLYNRMRQTFPVSPTKTLVTKTMLGVFGCIPAFDNNFCRGFGAWTVGKRSLDKISAFYRENESTLDAATVFTLDIATGRATARRYPRAKFIDMVFFQKGGGTPISDAVA